MSFEEGFLTFSQVALASGLDGFWRRLQGCFVFACYGDRFARELPCPWVAFKAPILQDAPKAFLHAWIQALKHHDVKRAIDRAHAQCRKEQKS